LLNKPHIILLKLCCWLISIICWQTCIKHDTRHIEHEMHNLH